MRRNHIKLIFGSIVSILLASCVESGLDTKTDGQNILKLDVSSKALETRATIDGVADYNENLMNTLDVFLYPATASNDVDATVRIHVEPAVNDSYTVKYSLTDEEIDNLFGADAESGTCRAYVIANIGAGNQTIGTETSINALKQLVVTSAGGTGNSFTDSVAEDGFVMDSDASDLVRLTTDQNGGKSLNGRVPLYRSASKVCLYVKVAESVTDESGTEWISQPEGMLVTFHNGVAKGYVGNDVDGYLFYTADDRQKFVNDEIGFVSDPYDFDGGEYYGTSLPFYTYPTRWTDESEDNVYMTLIVPWKKTSSTDYEQCRYQIPVNYDGMKLERNTCYNVLLKVGILGAFEEDEPVTIESSYVLVEKAQWGQETISVEMKENVYLVVNENDVVMNNVESRKIGYTSSHVISAVITSITQPDLSSAIVSTTEYYSSDTGTATVQAGTNGLLNACSVEVVDNQIVLTHELINRDETQNTTDDFDLTPYTITLMVTMQAGEQTYTEYITIVQYPSIYMEASLNSDHPDGESSSSNYGYVIVNGNNTADDSGTFGSQTISTDPALTGNGSAETVQWLAQVYQTNFTPGDHEAGIQNPNMYVLTLSSFQTNDYLIGDPRTVSYEDVFQIYGSGDYVTQVNGEVADNDGNGMWDYTHYMKMSASNYVWATSYALSGDTPRRLRYYYGTDESEASMNVIAPKIRFSSSHSIPAPIVKSKELAKRRCAAYQEDGYPAGRWRLPTKAEVEFTLGLNNASITKIPHVFNTTLAYWSAHGYFNSDMSFNTSTTTSGQGSVRCVYDEWYWGSEQLEDKTKFTWGDMPR